MLTREQSLENFKKNIDDLISSNYILAGKKISNLLKGISCSKLLFEMFAHFTENFDYQAAKKAAIQAGENYTDGKFILPSEPSSIIAFVFLFLYEVDSTSADLTKILGMCFFEGSYNESFRRFGKEVLLPFREEVILAVEKIIAAENAMIGSIASSDAIEPSIKSESILKPNINQQKLPESSINQSSQNIQTVQNYQNVSGVMVLKTEKPALNAEATKQIKSMMLESKAIILQYKMDNDVKSELMALYDDFSAQLYGNDSERLKLSFLGYKYSTLFHRRLDVSVGKIETILKQNGIL